MSNPNPFLRNWPAWLLACVAALGVLPFVLLSAFAHPSADDWYMASFILEKGFWKANVDFYFGITGRYFSSALLIVNPIHISFWAFKCYCAALVLGLVVSARWAIGAWFVEAASGWRWMLTVFVLVLFFWGMPSPAQGLYWGTGSMGYTLPCVLAFCLAAVLRRECLDSAWRPSAARCVGLCLLALAIVGSTEVAMALLLAHVVALNVLFLWRHRKISRPLFLLLVVTLLGVLVVVLAPGNANRQTWYANEVHHKLVPALLMAAKLAVRQAGVWLVFVPVFLFSLVMLMAWPQAMRPSVKVAWELVLVAVVLMAGTLLGGFFLGTWSMGAVVPLRAVNLQLLFFLVDWVILLAGIVGLLRSDWLPAGSPGAVFQVCALLIFLGGVAGVDNNIKTAWVDLLGGGASRFDHENAQRHAAIRSSPTPDVVVPALKARPKTLFFNDLTTDPTNWRNTGCASFFRKHSVTLDATSQ